MKSFAPLQITKGTDFAYKAIFLDGDKNPLDVSAYTHDATLKVEFNDATSILDFSVNESLASTGYVFLTLNDTQTDGLNTGRYRARFRRTLSGITVPIWSRQVVVVA
jgi:hypothetical protein